MTLGRGTRLGPYEILSAIGAGGMGEVYRARDTRLDRTVAIKVLPHHVSGDPALHERFEREARTVAALNHPHICTLHDVGRQDGTDFIVLEYLEGETLAARLAKGPIPLDQVLAVAIQIADALNRAHRAGVIHRDLKPGNIMLTKSGAKLLDFGLAKVTQAVVAASGLSIAPTGITPVTMQGTILGTLQYMAPEQIEGQEADARTDLFAFGCVLYEMVAGTPAFHGNTQASLIGAILKDTPPPMATIPLAPPALERVVMACLAKSPEDRWQSARDVLRELQWLETSARSHDAAASSRRSAAWVPWSIAAASLLLAVAAVGVVAYVSRGAPPSSAEMRVQILAPSGPVTSFALSPDGQSLVFSADGQLWLRSLGSETAHPLPGTEDGLRPFWSPDGRSIAFFSDDALKRFDIGTNAVQALAGLPLAGSGTWGSDGTILFEAGYTLHRVRAGEKPADATHLNAPAQAAHVFPRFLPDGRHFLFYVIGTPEGRGVYVGTLDSFETHRLVDADSTAIFVAPDHLLFSRQGMLMAQRFDIARLEVLGTPFLVADQVGTDNLAPGDIALSAAANGTFAYRPIGLGSKWQLAVIDRTGKQLNVVGQPEQGEAVQERLSPDGRTVAVSRTINANRDIWLMDLSRGVLSRATSDPAREGQPVWSPDSKRLVFFSDRSGTYDLYLQDVGGVEQPLLKTEYNKNVYDWSPDGRFVLYAVQNPTSRRDLWALPLDGDRQPVAVAQTAFEELEGRFSPDGRWIAYQSNDTGRNEIYVQPFPFVAGGKVRVSTSGGTQPRWRADGRELFYRSGTDVMGVAVASSRGATLETASPARLFSLPQTSEFAPVGTDRFLINAPTDVPVAPITLILNWKGAAK
ncbi:MAG TPA: protein kinase [Vicinamibacterales bacterium]|nr:protein kinase [Vicinamibacterales bacterium]